MSPTILKLVLAIIVGGFGAFVAVKAKLPAGVFLGPVIFVGTYKIFSGLLIDRPVWFRVGIQIAIGIILGSNFSQVCLKILYKLIKPALTVCFLWHWEVWVWGCYLTYFWVGCHFWNFKYSTWWLCRNGING
ncbi:MAG: AbrB family transcriptional regulator [Peptococcaceae bacterium]